MNRRFHFISGLPRSGSTLLAALLRQNPAIHAEMSSPLCALYMQALSTMSARSEFHSFFTSSKREDILRGLFHSYYSSVDSTRNVVFDTNRAWCGKLSGLVRLFPDAKVICCVRSNAWILDSIERIVQNNPHEPSRMFNFEAGSTVYKRVDMLTKTGGLLSAAYDNLREGFYGEHAGRLLLVNYESLASQPLDVLRKIYEFLDLAHFDHDVGHVEYSADEFDTKLGTPGLHKVSGPVELKHRPTILPPDIFNKFKASEFWREPNKNPRGVQVV